MQNRPFHVEYQGLSWLDSHTPYSEQFQDSYFSAKDGVNESLYVYLGLNDIRNKLSINSILRIGELGFGTGLNLLLTMKALAESPHRSARVEYLSCERYPLCLDDLIKIWALWPALTPYAEELQHAFQPLVPGFIRLRLMQGRFAFTLAIGDAQESLAAIDCSIDAWYLDGFAPDRNPELWTEELMHEVARLSRIGASASSYTSAGNARRALERVGFHVEKVPGFAGKRESIRCSLREKIRCAPRLPIWLRLPHTETELPESAIIVGGGISGHGVAHALAQRGIRTTIIDRGDRGIAGASNNPLAILAPHLGRTRTMLTDFLLPSFLFALQQYQSLQMSHEHRLINRCAAIQFCYTPRLQRLREELDSLGYSKDLVAAMEQDETPALLLSRAHWLIPHRILSAIREAHQDRISYKTHTTVTKIEKQDQGWRVMTEHGDTLCADALIFCNAHEGQLTPEISWMSLEPIRGELIEVSSTPQSKAETRIQMERCYIIPEQGGRHVVGADYAHGRMDLTEDPEVHRRLLQNAVALQPALKESTVVGSRASFRCSTHHRLPYTGPVIDALRFQEVFGDLQKGYPSEHYTVAPQYLSGLYTSLGHGSRGFVSGISSGEVIADYLCGSIPLFSRHVLAQLLPHSNLVAKLRRGE